MEEAQVTVELPGGARTLVCPVQTGPARLLDSSATARALSDGLTAAAVERSGRTPSCRAGCAHCCRQLVPVSGLEARGLARTVAAMPRPLKTRIEGRFRRLVRHLSEAGWLRAGNPPGTRPLRVRTAPGETPWEAASRAWFEAHLDCPFLEDEACVIYPDRPFACREYLVFSDPALCATLDPALEALPRSTSLTEATARVAARFEPGRTHSLPLVLALEWAAAHPEPRTLHDGEALFHALVESMAEVGD